MTRPHQHVCTCGYRVGGCTCGKDDPATSCPACVLIMPRVGHQDVSIYGLSSMTLLDRLTGHLSQDQALWQLWVQYGERPAADFLLHALVEVLDERKYRDS